MAAQKQYLHELLKEDQEPFHLKKYIANRRCQLKRSNDSPLRNPSTSMQLKKGMPITESSRTTLHKSSLCRHACFLSFHGSPVDLRKSPFLDLHPSPAKSPCRRNQSGTIFLHVPARTAALLLEAAMRIQKQHPSSSSSSSSVSVGKPKSQETRNKGLGLFFSILKKLKDRNKNKKVGNIRDTEFNNISVKNDAKVAENVTASASATTNCEDRTYSCSCNNSRLSSAGWSESNEDSKSIDMETSTSGCRSEVDHVNDRVMVFVAEQSLSGDCSSCEYTTFCSSPIRFSLQRSPSSSGCRTPDFPSPAVSPCRHINEEDKNKYEGNGCEKSSKLEEEEDEKEQCSPVSVLDPQFQDEEEHDEEDAEEDYDLECSFAIVQKAKEQLLYKLRRFEKLAELDPVELEKRMMEQLDDEDEIEEEAEEDIQVAKHGDNELMLPLHRGCSLESFVSDVCRKSSLRNRRKIPTDMKRLVSDLISEEKREIKSWDNKEMVVGRVCKKLDSWKEVESNTIDMMVELDFRSESELWKKFQEQREDTAVEIEIAIFGLLVEEIILEELP